MAKIADSRETDITISVVSHLQIGLVAELLADLDRHCRESRFELILTLNLDENVPFDLDEFSYPIKLVRNVTPMGFGANHNQAFTHASGRYFCVMNPDIRLGKNPFNTLLVCFDESTVGVAAPLVLNVEGGIEDSARRFPTPLKILCKVFGQCRGSDYAITESPIYPDWVGGMFMLFPRGIFAKLGGFDQGYFLYYEDVDICARLKLLGLNAVVCPQARVVHHAQRSSHRNLTYLRWHLKSMLRFFVSRVFWRLQFLPSR
jgi:hypothetical protein